MGKYLNEAAKVLKNLSQNYFDLGSNLIAAENNREYDKAGYDTPQQYWDVELGLSASRGLAAISIAKLHEKEGVDPKDLVKMGPDKAYALWKHRKILPPGRTIARCVQYAITKPKRGDRLPSLSQFKAYVGGKAEDDFSYQGQMVFRGFETANRVGAARKKMRNRLSGNNTAPLNWVLGLIEKA